MLASATSAALVTLTTEADATELVEARARVNAAGARVSYNDLLTWLIGKALTEHPRLNTHLDGDVIRYGGAVHVGIAVDAEKGLLVPVLRDAHSKSLREIAEASAELIRAARDGSAAPPNLRGSTFTLTNLGAFGIDAFTPLPNLPEGAILGVGRIKPSPAVVGGELCVRQMVWLSLTFDHRLLDGALAARFLQRLAEMIGDQELLASA
jgi:pyruvate dehydrogenase E2 component (dihydrolipoamide acetyltransferase)